MEGVLIALGCLLILIGLFSLFVSWHAISSNKQMGISHSLNPADKRTFGNPGLGLTIGVMAILIGVLLIVSNA